ncbi:hypothetical protein PISMIDRAFT_460244 [Pisolithus microcarpus 441]|uniref:Unplaced genomic scaffold scaffold_42, whole genome shotgun sequence n=1 Tax=Pisolithus microcarpus 441 TaxID=765257 RepID=A0A0C9Z304_9AGAM|nr:hypothetical protein PISMIDRAFT_460244 [Pisolithus microcarpus 441]
MLSLIFGFAQLNGPVEQLTLPLCLAGPEPSITCKSDSCWDTSLWMIQHTIRLPDRDSGTWSELAWARRSLTSKTLMAARGGGQVELLSWSIRLSSSRLNTVRSCIPVFLSLVHF